MKFELNFSNIDSRKIWKCCAKWQPFCFVCSICLLRLPTADTPPPAYQAQDPNAGNNMAPGSHPPHPHQSHPERNSPEQAMETGHTVPPHPHSHIGPHGMATIGKYAAENM